MCAQSAGPGSMPVGRCGARIKGWPMDTNSPGHRQECSRWFQMPSSHRGRRECVRGHRFGVSVHTQRAHCQIVPLWVNFFLAHRVPMSPLAVIESPLWAVGIRSCPSRTPLKITGKKNPKGPRTRNGPKPDMRTRGRSAQVTKWVGHERIPAPKMQQKRAQPKPGRAGWPKKNKPDLPLH